MLDAESKRAILVLLISGLVSLVLAICGLQAGKIPIGDNDNQYAWRNGDDAFIFWLVILTLFISAIYFVLSAFIRLGILLDVISQAPWMQYFW